MMLRHPMQSILALQTIVLLLTAASLTGQKRVVFPFGYEKRPGESWGFLLHTCRTCLPKRQTFQALFKTGTVSGTVASIAFRRTNAPNAKRDIPEFTADLEVGMGHSPRLPRDPSWKLQVNRGTDFRIVFRRKTIVFAPAPYQAKLPYPFTYHIPFDRPFPLKAHAVGIWEIHKYASSLVLEDYLDVGFDEVSRHRDPSLYKWPVPFGKSCGSFLDGSQLAVGSVAYADMSRMNGATSRSIGVVFGGWRSDFWGPWKLPLDLKSLGASGCAVYVSLDWIWPVIYRDVEITDVAVDMPLDTRLKGRDIFLQGLVTNVVVNSLGVVTSNGLRAEVGPTWDVDSSMLWAPRPWDHTANWLRIGYRWMSSCTVFQLAFQ